MLPCEEVGRPLARCRVPADFSERRPHATFSFGDEEETAGEGIERGNRDAVENSSSQTGHELRDRY